MQLCCSSYAAAENGTNHLLCHAGFFERGLERAPSKDKAEKAPSEARKGLHMPHLFAEDPHPIGQFKVRFE